MLGLAIAACGNPQTTPGPASEAPATAVSPATPGPSPDTESRQPTVLPSPSPEANEEQPGEPDTPKTVAPLYRMNKVYRIVPIDEQATNAKVVLLTFDDGPKEETLLAQILDTLDRHNAKAIFFVNGYRVKAKPELLKMIDERGQVIGNHAYDHINLSKEPEESIRRQIEDVQQLVQDATGKTPAFFRPPFGASNEYVRQVARDNGLLFMTWSNGSLDWDLGKVADKPQAVIDNVMKQLHPGSNILMHELQWTADALDRLLTQLENEGYTFVDPNTIERETASD
jgi:peptidoglycan/xylan/chitin deacetylase (PgdA/CDA1 family)